MKQILLPILAVFAFILAVGLFFQKTGANTKFKALVIPTPLNQKVIYVNQTKINAEIADTEVLREKGLSGRKELKEGSGMLFIFKNKDIFPVFWMKDMLIPIDIVWINDDKIVKIDKEVPIPEAGTTDQNLKKYTFREAVDYILEVPAGFSDASGFKVGSLLDLSRIGK
jgi:uncharacterized membrane protein (UPF0127 family)